MKLKGPSKVKSPGKVKHDALKDAKRMTQLWEQHAPTFRVKGVKLKELLERSKNNELDISAMDEVIEDMESGAAHECSGKWQDEEGNLLFIAFANRILSEGKLFHRPRSYSLQTFFPFAEPPKCGAECKAPVS